MFAIYSFFTTLANFVYFSIVSGAVGGGDDGGDGDDKEKAEEEERERQEAIREAEDRRKEKHRKMEEEREKMRQEIRDKVCSEKFSKLIYKFYFFIAIIPRPYRRKVILVLTSEKETFSNCLKNIRNMKY